MEDSIGIISGLMGGQMSGRDTTNVDPKLLAIMAMRRKQNGLDNEPKVTVEDDIKAINSGKNQSMTKEQHDSLAATFNRKDWLKHIDSMGLEVVPKKKQ